MSEHATATHAAPATHAAHDSGHGTSLGVDSRKFRIWLPATAGLGLCFLSGQAYEFTKLISEGVTFGSSMFGTTFFVLTGFHGTHVAIGVTWLLSVFTKVWRYPDAPGNDMDVELGGLYWHFVDLV